MLCCTLLQISLKRLRNLIDILGLFKRVDLVWLLSVIYLKHFFFSALIECHLDAGRKTDASGIAQAAATFIKQNVPHLYKQVFGLIVSCISFEIIWYKRVLVLSEVLCWSGNCYLLEKLKKISHSAMSVISELLAGLIIPPATKLGGVYWNHPVCL